MSKVMVLGLPYLAHMNPTLGLVKELAKQGEEVWYYSAENLQETVENTGAVFRQYQFPSFMKGALPKGASFQQFTKHVFGAMEYYAYMADHIQLSDHEKPDYIMFDSCAYWGKLITQRWNLPSIAYHCVFAYTDEWLEKEFEFLIRDLIGLDEDYLKNPAQTKRILQILLTNVEKHYHIGRFEYTSTGMKNLVFTSRQFQPLDSYFKDDFKFVGPQIYQRNDATDFPVETLADSLIYITLGTSFNENPEFFRKCFEAFRDIELQVVMTVGKNFDISTLGEIPTQFVVKNYVPQREVIQRAKLVISAGGLGTVSEAIYYGVPLLVYPYGADQYMVAKQVEKLQAGISIGKDITALELKELANQTMTSTIYCDNLKIIGDSFREAGGVTRAVAEINAFKEQYSIPD